MKRAVKYVLNRVPRPVLLRVAHIVTPVLGLFYAGRRVECPICGRRYRKFMPYGYETPRENAMCPKCLSLERHRMMWLYLTRCTDFFTARPHLLHVAPEQCFIKRFERLLGEDYVTADLESPLARVKMDIQAIPFGDDTFDVIFCNHILEHVEDDRLAMREMYRVMKPGGWGMILCPVNPSREVTYEDPSITDPGERRRAFGQYDHFREYGTDYAARLAGAGFDVEAIDMASLLTPQERERYCIGVDMVYIAHKR